MLGNRTNAGKEHLRRASEAEKAVAAHFGMELVPFPESRTSRVDGVIVSDGAVVAVYEVKSRTGDLRFEAEKPVFKFREKTYDSMLVASHKIDTMAEISKLLQVASFLITTYSNGYIGIIKVANQKGSICVEGMERKVVRTRATVVGGTANRENCFIPLSTGTYIEK